MPNTLRRVRVHTRIAVALACGLAVSAAGAAKAPSMDRSGKGRVGVEQGEAKQAGQLTYIVRLADPAVAAYSGGGKSGLQATSARATGARKLDT
ncbi:MAG: hypothetical protein KJO55_06495, partial [Gammaproteobacteria bacterium]|nr:hypothetical protein [Gammaproteobacteria bacterium]